MAVTGLKWVFDQGEDPTLDLIGVDTTDPSSWGLLFTLVLFNGDTTAILTKTPSVSGPDFDGKFSISVSLSRSETMALLDPSVDGPSKKYTWDVWRTDLNENVVLASGYALVYAPERTT